MRYTGDASERIGVCVEGVACVTLLVRFGSVGARRLRYEAVVDFSVQV